VLEVTPQIQIPDDELSESFVRSSGPGGQNVNKVSSAVELRFDVAHSSALPELVRQRLLQRRDRRLTDDGVLVISANRFRDQSRNREDARLRLAEIVLAATVVPKKRIATKPTKGAQERRLQEKKTRSAHKRDRTKNWKDE
jgi:ribosome-associated protein